MEKDIAAILGGEVIVAREVDCTPEELEIMAKQLRLAAEERANPKDVVYIKTKGIVFRYNPLLSRSQLERKLSMKLQEDFVAIETEPQC